MKVVRYYQYGDQSVLRYEHAERPAPAAGQVLVQVAGSAFNPVDAAIRAGYLQDVFAVTFPHVPGFDVSGTVAAVGSAVTGFELGQAVVGLLPMNEGGAAAEYVLAPADALTAAPTRIPLPEASALPSAGLTAWQALFEEAGLRPDQRILVVGAGGSVGGLAVQLAKSAGAYVIATASPRSARTVRANGADLVIDHTTESVPDSVGRPVDVVLNLAPISGPEQAALARLVAAGGTFVTTVPPGPGQDVQAGVRVVNMFVRSDATELRELVAKVDAGQLRIVVSETRRLDELRAIHAASDAGKLHGKVVVVPAGQFSAVTSVVDTHVKDTP